MEQPPRYRFGLFELDLEQGELRREGRRRPLQDLPLRLLGELVRRPGRVVSRRELQAALWPDGVHVDYEGSLNAAVRRLREALGDSASDPRYVETVPRRGYRFLAPVQREEEPSADVAVGARSADETPRSAAPQAGVAPARRAPEGAAFPIPRRAPALGWLAVVCSLGLLVWISSFGRGPAPPAGPEKVAVLPLRAFGDDDRLLALAAGLTEELTMRLGRVAPSRLRVVAAGSARRAGERGELEEIGKVLDVEYVVEGSLRSQGEQVRVGAQLVSTGDRRVLWSESFDRRLGNMLDLERELAQRVSEALRLALLDGAPLPETPRVADEPTVDRDAYEHYLRGRYFLGLDTPEGYLRAEEELRAALDRAPGFAAGWAGLAQVHATLGSHDVRRPHDAFPEAEVALRRALELEPENTEALLARAMVTAAYHWRLDVAEADLRRLVERWPNHVEARRFYGLCLAATGRHREASEQLEEARRLDPLSLQVLATIGWNLFLQGRLEEAIAATREILELETGWLIAWDDLKWFYTVAGREAEAAEAFFRVVALEGEPEAVPYLRGVYAEHGFHGLLEVSLESQLERAASGGYQSPYDLVLTFAALGRVDEAMEWLGRSFAEREVDLMVLPSDPRIASLRAHPEYARWMDRLKAGAAP